MEEEYEKDVLSKKCGLSWKLLALLTHIFNSQKAFRESKKEHWKAYFGEFGDAEHPPVLRTFAEHSMARPDLEYRCMSQRSWTH